MSTKHDDETPVRVGISTGKFPKAHESGPTRPSGSRVADLAPVTTDASAARLSTILRLDSVYGHVLDRWPTWTVWIKGGALVILALLALLLVKGLPPFGSLPGSDGLLYYRAALDVGHGTSPYRDAVAWSNAHAPTDPANLSMDDFVYPPLFALLLAPFAALLHSATAFLALWALLSIACAVYVSIALLRFIAPHARGFNYALAFCAVLDAVLLFGPLRHNMRADNMDIEMIALLIGAWMTLRQGRDILSGVLLGLAIFIKPTYLLLLGFHLWKREWRSAAVALAVGVGGLVVPFLIMPHQVLADYIHVSAFYNTPGFLMAPRSISVFGFIERLSFTIPVLWRVFTAPLVVRALVVLVALGVYLWASSYVSFEGRERDARWDYAFALAILVMLLASPITEDAHLSLTLLPLTIMSAPWLVRLWRGDRTAVVLLALVAAFYVYVTIPVRGLASFSIYTGPRALLAGYWFYGLIFLAGLYAWAGSRQPYQRAGQSVLAQAWEPTRVAMHLPEFHLGVVTSLPERAAPWIGDLARIPGRTIAWTQRLAADRWLLAALGVSLGSLVLRAVGTNVGLPYHFHWDEPTIVNRAIRMGSGDLNPHFFIYPGLSFYMTFAIEACLYVVGHLLHVYPSVNDYAAAYFTNSTPFYLVARLFGSLLGAATVVLCYVVGRRFFTRPIALLAAVMLAVSPVSVANGHFVTNDVPMTFFTLLAYVWLWDVYTVGRRRDYILVGIATGLGIATKYFPILLLVSLVLAHMLRIHRETARWWPQRLEQLELGRVVLGVGAALVTFVVCSPYSVLDWRNAIHDYTAQGQLSGAAGSTTAPLNFLPYLTQELGWGAGWPVYVAALAGVAAILWTRGERRFQFLLLASYPLLYFITIGSARQPFARYLVTIQPFLALSAAAFAWWCAGRAPYAWHRLAPRARVSTPLLSGIALAVLMLLLVVPPAVTSAQYDSYLTRTDPRTQAVQWFSAHVPAGTTVAVQPMFDRYFLNAPIMTESQLATLEQDIPANKPAIRETVDSYYRAHGVYPDVPFVYDVATLRADGVRYVVISSFEYHTSADIAAEDRFYSDLSHQARVAARFVPSAVLSDGDLYPVSMPTISIFALSPSAP